MPSQLRLLHGETRPSKLNFDQPVPAGLEPGRPDWFDDRHLAVWDRVTGELRAMHLLHAADQDTLVCYVRAILRHADAAKLAMKGVLVEGSEGGMVRNPAVIIEVQAAEQVRRFAREFGLTPSSRADLAGTPSPSGMAADRLLSG